MLMLEEVVKALRFGGNIQAFIERKSTP